MTPMMKAGLALACGWTLVAAACSSGSGTSSPPGGTGGGTVAVDAGGSGGGSGSGGSGGSAEVGTGSGGAPVTGSGGAPVTGSGGSGPVTGDGSAPDGAVTSGWPAVTDFAATGPFPIQHEMNLGPGNGYDVVRPMTLGAGGRKHPIISWNNGTLYAIARYQPLLDHLASHGFVVIGAHTNATAGGAVHKAGIDWLVAQNASAQSPYRDMLDVKLIGAAGHSQGGWATLAAASDKPGPTGIVAAMPLMPIMFNNDTTIIRKLNGPLLIISADQDPRSLGVADQTMAMITTPFVDAEFKGVHEDAMNVAMHAPALAWFRLHLMNDQTAAKAFFYPASTCGLCTSAAYMRVRYKN